MLFVQYGELEVYTSFEGNRFVIDRLYQGSVINYRSFFMEDMTYANIRAFQNSHILEYSLDDFMDL